MPPRVVAFFGATGGCANACLAHTLLNGHNATALVRSPEKLYALLERNHNVPREICSGHLRIVDGDVKDLEAVQKTLAPFNGQDVDTIIDGIGGIPKPQLDPFKPLINTDPTICADAVEMILLTLKELPESRPKPLLAVISANGVLNSGPRDYPLALMPLYRWMLTGVFDDKRKMENILQNTRWAGGNVVVRPSVLQDDPGKGLENIRQGWTEEPVMGWSISRADVGLWMFENLIQSDDEERSKFQGRGVQITY